MQLFDNESAEYLPGAENDAPAENANNQGGSNYNGDDQQYYEDVYRNHGRDFINDAGQSANDRFNEGVNQNEQQSINQNSNSNTVIQSRRTGT